MESKEILDAFLNPLCDHDESYNDDYLDLFTGILESEEGAWVKYKGKKMLFMASYDYLGLLEHPKINKICSKVCEINGAGSRGTPLLGGITQLHLDLEKKIANILGTEDALIFSSGYVANLATISTLVGAGDAIISDNYVHASIVDGCKLSGAQLYYFKHNSIKNLENFLKNLNAKRKLVIIESVYSMDGDIADIPGISELCQKYKATLMIDEAHSFGCVGPDFGIQSYFGIKSDLIPIKMGTLSKTIPATGGYVAGSKKLINILKSKSRGYVFSAILSPVLIKSALESISIIEKEPQRKAKLNKNISKYVEGLKKMGFDTLNSETMIVPIITSTPEKTFKMTKICRENNLLVYPILYPVVPKRLPRIRTTITSKFEDRDIEYALQIFEKAGKQLKLI